MAVLDRENSEVIPEEFQMDSPYRRSLYYCSAGVLVCGLAVLLVAPDSEFEGITPLQWVIAAILYVVGTVFPIWWASHVRIRVDSKGIYRRVFFRWQFWSWGLFSTGDTRLGETYASFVFPNQPWNRRTLTLGYLPESDYERLYALCKEVWVRPAPPIPPEKLDLKLGSPLGRKFIRHRIEADATGLIITHRGVHKCYAWNDVQRLVFVRASREHQTFRLLQLVLPDRTEKLEVVESKHKMWAGPPSEIVSAFFERYVSLERIVSSGYGDSDRSVAEIDAYLDEIAKRERMASQISAVAFVGLALFIAWCLFEWYSSASRSKSAMEWMIESIAFAFLMLAGLLYLLAFVMGRRQVKEQQQNLIKQREALLKESPAAMRAFPEQAEGDRR